MLLHESSIDQLCASMKRVSWNCNNNQPPQIVRKRPSPPIDPPHLVLPASPVLMSAIANVEQDDSWTMIPVKKYKNEANDQKDRKEEKVKQQIDIIRELEIQAKTAPGIKTLIAHNIPRHMTRDQLRDIFEAYGMIRDIYIPKNADRNSPLFGTVRGFALIRYFKHEEALSAFQTLYARLNLQDHMIHLEFAKEDH